MSKTKRQTVAIVSASIGLACALTLVIHSLVTGQGIHSFGLLIGIFMALLLVQERKGRMWKGLVTMLAIRMDAGE